MRILDLGLSSSWQVPTTQIEGLAISGIVDVATMAFYADDPKMAERVWQVPLDVTGAALTCDSSSDLDLAHPPRERPEPGESPTAAETKCPFFGPILGNFQNPSKGMGLSFFFTKCGS